MKGKENGGKGTKKRTREAISRSRKGEADLAEQMVSTFFSPKALHTHRLQGGRETRRGMKSSNTNHTSAFPFLQCFRRVKRVDRRLEEFWQASPTLRENVHSNHSRHMATILSYAVPICFLLRFAEPAGYSSFAVKQIYCSTSMHAYVKCSRMQVLVRRTYALSEQ